MDVSAPSLYEDQYGWVVDMSDGDTSNPDCHWRFRTKGEAAAFVVLINVGVEPRYAAGKVSGYFR